MRQQKNTAIIVKDLKKSYGKLEVLKGIDLTVRRGTVFALLGPNGAGKTTAVRILSTLLAPDSGQVTVGGYDVASQAKKVRSMIGLTGQYAAIDEELSGQDNLAMMGRLYRLKKPSIRRRTAELLEQFDLTEAGHRLVKTYSGGMRRRLDLALSLIASPPIIFLDEPTTGLDPRSRLGMWQAIKSLSASGTTILLTTQYLEEADRLADRIAVLDEGTIIAEGTAEELKRRIGAERLELVMKSADDVSKAEQVIDGIVIKSDPAQRTISVATSGNTRDLEQIFHRVNAAKLPVESVTLAKPSLDDVFLDLTGHGVTAAKEKDKNHE